MSAWAGWPKIKALLTKAGLDMNTPIRQIGQGVPRSVPTDMIRYWYEGIVEYPFAAGQPPTITHEGLRVTVGVFLRMGGDMSPESEAATDWRLEDAERAVRKALWGDVALNADGTATATGLEIGSSTSDIQTVQGAWVRFVEIPLTYGVVDRHSIAQ